MLFNQINNIFFIFICTQLTLRPTRLYELKDGSVIEFGKVRAIYRTYHPADDTVVPETPAPTRQKIVERIIPNTPDSPLVSILLLEL